VGDTITVASNPNPQMVQGFEDVKPMVFAGIFPVDTDDFEELRDCMDKLQLNDASLNLRIRNITGPWVWFPLRLLRIAAHGDHTGTFGKRVSIKQ
jgi:hypothetical protein